MNTDTIIVDVIGFKVGKNEFVVKELAIATEEYTIMFLVKPPNAFNYLTKEEKKQVKWLESNHGIYWSEGFIDYREFKRIIVPYLNSKKIMTKGLEKVKWIEDLCSNCTVVDVGTKGCPNFVKLFDKYCNSNTSMTCVNHVKKCALKSVICIKKWYYDNHMYQFDIFY